MTIYQCTHDRIDWVHLSILALAIAIGFFANRLIEEMLLHNDLDLPRALHSTGRNLQLEGQSLADWLIQATLLGAEGHS